ncbi:MAG: TIM barrel protein [Opitutae bacterium]|nr:TIM barrel protein [Opitutae bacterium]
MPNSRSISPASSAPQRNPSTPASALSRRNFLRRAVGGTAIAVVSGPALQSAFAAETATAPAPAAPTAPGGRIKQTVSMGPGKMPFEEYVQACAKIGFKGFDLVDPDKFPILKKYGMVASMIPSHKLTVGLAHKENHESCLAKMRERIEIAAANGYPNVICFPGNRNGMPDDEGLKNCAEALRQIVGFAEQKNVTLCMELLNSKVNHKDYMCDTSRWGANLVEKVGSPRFKLLYDIYHMQVQEGDIIATIRKFKDYIAHYHTAGVPGRKDIDDSQELYYPAIMRAIAETGYQGYVGHEFTPKGDRLAALATAYKICDI